MLVPRILRSSQVPASPTKAGSSPQGWLSSLYPGWFLNARFAPVGSGVAEARCHRARKLHGQESPTSSWDISWMGKPRQEGAGAEGTAEGLGLSLGVSERQALGQAVRRGASPSCTPESQTASELE